ncbi:MAG: nicotinate phosphoribosyltransferase [Acidobacteriota bacterium]
MNADNTIGVVGLLTDLYELTMAAGYFTAGLADKSATFELSFRRLPEHRELVLAAGVAQAVEYMLDCRFTAEEVAYVRSLPQFARVPPDFFDQLAAFRFSGDVWAVPEGTPLFAGEPVLTVRGPLWQAQIFETYLLAMISFQTLIATKAARIVAAAGGRAVIEFGTRRAHSPEAGTLGGRAAYIGGCIGTSNTLTGFRYGIPVYGTAAHSWVLAFPDELAADRELQKLFGPSTIYLIDTNDTIEGARKAASLGKPLWGVRLDSGDLAALSGEVRRILDDAGLREAKIIASGDLDEYKIRDLVAAGAPIDAFGVGTELATSADAPTIGAIYKLVEIDGRYTAKFSTGKITLPGAKQIFRRQDRDLIALDTERLEGEPLMRRVVDSGKLVAPLPDAHAARAYAAQSLAQVKPPRAVEYSPRLLAALDEIRKHVEAAPV